MDWEGKEEMDWEGCGWRWHEEGEGSGHTDESSCEEAVLRRAVWTHVKLQYK